MLYGVWPVCLALCECSAELGVCEFLGELGYYWGDDGGGDGVSFCVCLGEAGSGEGQGGEGEAGVGGVWMVGLD